MPLQTLPYRFVHLRKIAFPTLEGFELILLDDIIQCVSDSNYTHVCLKSSRKILISRTLKEIEEQLDGYAFLRVHHSHLINLNEIVRYVRSEGGSLVMSDHSVVPVSRSRKEALLKIFG